MNRRQFVAGIGATGGGITIGSVAVSAGTGGDLPASQLSAGDVSPWDWVEPQSVATGEWITHSFGWFMSEEEVDSDRFDTSCEWAEYMLEVTEYEVRLPDRTIGFEESDAYWSDCKETVNEVSEGEYEEGSKVSWEYHTPPKSPGTYEFGITIEYLEEVEVCEPDGCFTVQPGAYEIGPATYEVT